MRKRLMAFLMAMALFVTGSFAMNINVRAEDIEQDVDFSSLLTEDALVGYMEHSTWGVYLEEGVSVINDAGGGKIGAGGITNAARRCTVSVNAIVERKVGTSWSRVTSWSATNTNAYVAAVSKTLSVTSGYYYRVRSIHIASTDQSGSYTAALWM